MIPVNFDRSHSILTIRIQIQASNMLDYHTVHIACARVHTTESDFK